MAEAADYIELVREAQYGDRDCLDRLAEMATVRLRAHVYRLTLREDVTQDIVQESVLEMIRILGKLKRPDRFWPWLYGIALNKLRRHRRNESRHRMKDIAEAGFGGAGEEKQEALERLLAEELRQAVSKAMGAVKPRHRAVLSMRCYDEMSFGEIAEAMGCSEFGAQMLFLRAKRSLGRQLARNGLGKGSLITALVIFGKMTASSEAAAAKIAVAAGTAKVGLAAAVTGAIASKAAVTTVSAVAAAGVITVGAMMIAGGGEKASVENGQGAGADRSVARKVVPSEAGANVCWYFFPEGATGPVMRRRMSGDEAGGKAYCAVLENERGNYHYDRRTDTVYMRNRRDYSEGLGVSRLPTDGPRLTAMLGEVQGGSSTAESVEYVSTKRKGLLVIARESEGVVTDISRVARHENMLEEEYFQFAWPEGTPTVDRRDAMHKRGWTYFRVEGRIGEAIVYGRGRVPFVYGNAARNAGWVELDVGGVKYYRGGDAMKGLGRPWMGLHTIDTVRRDGAESGAGFVTGPMKGGEKVQATLVHKGGRLVYSIDMERDLVESIDIVAGDVKGQLVFTYLQEIDEVGGEFLAPRVRGDESSAVKSKGIVWLLELGKKE